MNFQSPPSRLLALIGTGLLVGATGVLTPLFLIYPDTPLTTCIALLLPVTTVIVVAGVLRGLAP